MAFEHLRHQAVNQLAYRPPFQYWFSLLTSHHAGLGFPTQKRAIDQRSLWFNSHPQIIPNLRLPRESISCSIAQIAFR